MKTKVRTRKVITRKAERKRNYLRAENIFESVTVTLAVRSNLGEA